MASVYRKKSRSINNTVHLNNSLANFLAPPMKRGDLIVKRNEYIGNNVDISGNLTIDGNTRGFNYYASGNYYLNNYVLIPAGTIIQSAAISEPAGWLDCDGRILRKSEYLNLFNAISYKYSILYSGSDLSFNIPDLRGRVIVGVGKGSGLTDRTLGQTDGAERHTLNISEMPTHDHSSNGTVTYENSVYRGQGLMVIDGVNTSTTSDSINGATEPNIAATPVSLDIYTTGGGNSHNNMQPFIVLRYLIKY